MRVSHSRRFIFFASPKTGSESVRAVLDGHSDVIAPSYVDRTPENPFYSHITPVETRDLFAQKGWEFDAYFKFVFVRNPWVRLVSLYEMIYGRPGRIRPGFNLWLPTTRPDGRGGGGRDAERWRRYGTYSFPSYVHDERGHELVDAVVRLEHVADELPPILERLGIDERLPHVNKGRRSGRGYQDYYSARSRKLVAERYAYEIERFGYEF